MTTEAYARLVIDKLLEAADWDILDEAQVSTEEQNQDGRADYLLKNTRSQPLAVIEAKRFSIDPYSAKEQARDYTRSLYAPFIILSNGKEHYFWDYRDGGDGRPILGFPTQADLERLANLKLRRRGSSAETLAMWLALHLVTLLSCWMMDGHTCQTNLTCLTPPNGNQILY